MALRGCNWVSFMYTNVVLIKDSLHRGMMTSLDDVILGACEELKEQVITRERLANGEDLGDIIHEVADSWVPIYSHDLLSVAMSSLWLTSEEAEL